MRVANCARNAETAAHDSTGDALAGGAAQRAQANSAASAAPGSAARMNASPTRNAWTPCARIVATSAGARMPLSVTTSRSGGNARQQVERRLERDLERAQVAVVDADQRRRRAQARGRARPRRALRPAPPCRARARAPRSAASCASSSAATISRIASAPSARASAIWYSSTMKSLRSTGSAHARARRRQIFGRALEVLAVGQHRQARGAAALVARGDRRPDRSRRAARRGSGSPS